MSYSEVTEQMDIRKHRIHFQPAIWSLALLLLASLTPSLSRADAMGRVQTTDGRIQPEKGMGAIRWKAIAKVYVLSIPNNGGIIEVEIRPDQIQRMEIARPAGLDEAIRMAQTAGKQQQAIPLLDAVAKDYLRLEWDETATRWLAECYLFDDKADLAVRACERVIEQKADTALVGDMAFAYWKSLLAAGRNGKLSDLLAEACKPTQPIDVQARAYIMRGDVAKKQGDAKAALRDGYLRAIVLCPAAREARPTAFARAAQCFQEMGKILQADRMRRGDQTLPPTAARITAESETDREVRYATGLIDLGLPDFGVAVVEKLMKNHPEASAAGARIKIDALAAQGNFKDAEAEISKMPSNSVEAMSMRLAVSDRYWQFGKLEKARQGYELVLNAYPKEPPPEIKGFYVESAYKFAQMLQIKEDNRGAVKALRCVLNSKPDDDYTRRRIETEMAELLVKVAEQAADTNRTSALKEARILCNDVMWTQDDLFGRAVVILAHGTKLEGNPAKARELILSKMPMLQTIENEMRDAVMDDARSNKQDKAKIEQAVAVALRDSPMSQCKYLIGTLHEEEGRTLAAQPGAKDADVCKQMELALEQYFTIIMRYPYSAWAPEACQHVDGVAAFLKEHGHSFEMPSGVDMGPVAASRFRDAHTLFQDSNYSGAIKRFIQALNMAPNHQDAVPALGELAQCYMQDQNERYARAVVNFLSERFSQDDQLMPAAGNAFLGVAHGYLGAGQGPRARSLYVQFTEQFPKHDQTPTVLKMLGDKALSVTNYADAVPLYQRIVEKYNQPGVIYNESLSRLAACQLALGDSTNSIQTLKTYFSVLPNGAEKLVALLRIADAYRQNGEWDKAALSYGGIVDVLNNPKNPYSAGPEDGERNRKTMERALYGRAFCFSRNRQPPEKVSEYQAKAIEGYESFLKKYPTSDLAPSVLCNIGTLYYLLNKPEEAGKSFDRLAKDFPDNPLAQNVLFAQVESLIQLGQTDKAGEILDKMIENAAKYKPPQFLKVGQDFLEAKQYASAVKALEKARAGSTDRNIWEPASAALGQALQGAGQTEPAIKVIEELLKAYPKTSHTVQASMTLGRARAVLAQVENNPARKAELFKKAISAMYKAAGFVQDAGTRAELELEISAMQFLMGEKSKSLGSYQRLFETSDPKLGVKVAACMETAFAKMMPMLVEAKRSKDIVASCDEYLSQFPNGKYRSEAISWRTQFSEAGSAMPVAAKAVEASKAETSPDVGTSTSKVETVAATVKAAESVVTNAVPTASTNKVTKFPK